MSSIGSVHANSPETEAETEDDSISFKPKKHADDIKSDVSHYASIEISIENINIKLHDAEDARNEESVSAHSVEIREVPYHKAVPNKWRVICKHHFEDFWDEYFSALFDDDLNIEYKDKFAELKIDDIRCIPFIHMKHLLNHVHMLKDDAKKAFKEIQRFKRNNDMFFKWVSNNCQCQKYIPDFQNAGILTWKTFAKSIVSKSDLNDIIPENQMNNNIDRKVLWSNIPSDIWDYYQIDRQKSPMGKKKGSLHYLFPSAVNLRPDISWNYKKTRHTPQKYVEYLWICFLALLFVVDVVMVVFIVINDTIPYFSYVVNISNTIHFIVQLLLILGWMEWLVFVQMNGCIKCIQWIIELLLFVSTLILWFNIAIYGLHFVYGAKDNFIQKVSNVESNKFCRNTWFILNGVAFISILAFIGFISMKKICKEEIKDLALRKAGEDDMVRNVDQSGALCRYLSLTIVRYLILTMFINMLMMVQTGVWLYWRYIQVPLATHHEVRHKYEFKIIIFVSDILCVLLGTLLIFYLRKQRINYEIIKEINHSKRRFNANSSFDSHDLHKLNGINTNRDSPIL